ncbi:MAG: hypothetical protein GY856_14085 [bacterium]|nr:hypothetical protein [bacterium]
MTAVLIAATASLLAKPAGSDPATATEESTAAVAEAPVTLEIRLAAGEPHEGWIEARFPGIDEPIYMAPEVALSHLDVERTWYEDMGEGPMVGLLMTEDGALKLARLSRRSIGERIAIVVNGKIVSAPFVAGEISERALIRGNFTEEEARALAAALDSNAGQ